VAWRKNSHSPCCDILVTAGSGLGQNRQGLRSQSPAALHQNLTHNQPWASIWINHLAPSSVRLAIHISTFIVCFLQLYLDPNTIVPSEERGIITHPNFTILKHHHIIPSLVNTIIVFVLT
jgi:hypothetical protein